MFTRFRNRFRFRGQRRTDRMCKVDKLLLFFLYLPVLSLVFGSATAGIYSALYTGGPMSGPWGARALFFPAFYLALAVGAALSAALHEDRGP